MSPSVRLTAFLLAAVYVALTQPAMAQNANAGRYTMHKANDGFLRLDTKTGAVSFCRNKNNWTCAPVEGATPQDREKIALLEQENAELKRKIKVLEDLVVKQGNGHSLTSPPKPDDSKSGWRLPSEQDVDKALNYFENMLRKLQERLERLEQDRSQEEGNAL